MAGQLRPSVYQSCYSLNEEEQCYGRNHQRSREIPEGQFAAAEGYGSEKGAVRGVVATAAVDNGVATDAAVVVVSGVVAAAAVLVVAVDDNDVVVLLAAADDDNDDGAEVGGDVVVTECWLKPLGENVWEQVRGLD